MFSLLLDFRFPGDELGDRQEVLLGEIGNEYYEHRALFSAKVNINKSTVTHHLFCCRAYLFLAVRM